MSESTGKEWRVTWRRTSWRHAKSKVFQTEAGALAQVGRLTAAGSDWRHLDPLAAPPLVEYRVVRPWIPAMRSPR